MLQHEERKVSPGKRVISDLTRRTYPFRRQEILERPQLIRNLLQTYPSLKRSEQVQQKLCSLQGLVLLSSSCIVFSNRLDTSFCCSCDTWHHADKEFNVGEEKLVKVVCVCVCVCVLQLM